MQPIWRHPSVGPSTPPPKRPLSRMQLALHATRQQPLGASSLVQQAVSVWPVETRHIPPWRCRNVKVFGCAYDYGHACMAWVPLPPTLKQTFFSSTGKRKERTILRFMTLALGPKLTPLLSGLRSTSVLTGELYRLVLDPSTEACHGRGRGGGGGGGTGVVHARSKNTVIGGRKLYAPPNMFWLAGGPSKTEKPMNQPTWLHTISRQSCALLSVAPRSRILPLAKPDPNVKKNPLAHM